MARAGRRLTSCAGAEICGGPASNFGVPKLRRSRWWRECLGCSGLGVEGSQRDAVWLGGGSGEGSSLYVGRVRRVLEGESSEDFYERAERLAEEVRVAASLASNDWPWLGGCSLFSGCPVIRGRCSGYGGFPPFGFGVRR